MERNYFSWKDRIAMLKMKDKTPWERKIAQLKTKGKKQFTNR